MTLTNTSHQQIPSPTTTAVTQYGPTEATLPTTRNEPKNARNETRAGIPMPSMSGPSRTAAAHAA